ncbi:MAG: LPS-assembly protein LptD [Schwartzia sp. (in: firmicutes)]
MEKARGAVRIYLALSVAAAIAFGGGGAAEAYYYSDDLNTDTEILDYIENARRHARENALTEAQQELRKDVAEMNAHLRAPIDPARLPIALEGDDMFYDEATGEVYAKGNVRITEIDARRFLSEEARGNLKEQVVKVDGRAHLVQMTPGAAQADMEGYRAVYHYGKQTGRMEEVKGKYGQYYITGRRIEMYPDKILIYDGSQTKCGAKTPDYRLSGDLIEIYPGKEMLIHEVKYWLKDKVIYTRSLYRQDLSKPEKGLDLPRVGYDSDNGAWIGQKFDWQITPHINAYANVRYYSRAKARNMVGVDWGNGGNSISLQYGQFHDTDNHWIKKAPTLIYQYSHALGDLPASYTLKYEIGRWKDRYTSTHRYYGVTVTPNPLPLGRTARILTSFGYAVTKESYDNSTVKGFDYSATLMKDFGRDVTAYVRYSYSSANINNSLFAYNLDAYSRKLSFGVSWALSDRDRFVMGQSFDVETRRREDVDYYWFHDMHCAQLILRYRAKRSTWHVTMQFTPW